jgi:hypothetical protein
MQTRYTPHFQNSGFYNFPAWPGGVRGGFKAVRRAAARDQHRPLGKYTILTTIAQKYTTNVGHPGFSNAAVDEVFNKFLIPQMFAEVARGERSPDEAARVYQRQIGQIFAKWRRRGKIEPRAQAATKGPGSPGLFVREFLTERFRLADRSLTAASNPPRLLGDSRPRRVE